MKVAGNVLADFASAPVWLQDGGPDFVDQTDFTDQNYDSIGCGMAFLSWLISKGHSLASIAQKMVALGDSGTLAHLYTALTGDRASNAWPKFVNAVNGVAVNDDDPFGALPVADAAKKCDTKSHRLFAL